MKVISTVLTACLVLVSAKAFSWSKQGHKIIVEIAKSHLDRHIIEQVDHYLDGMSWEEAACWMDEMHDVKQYAYMKPWHYVNIEKDKTYVRTKEEDVIAKLEFCFRMLQYKSIQPKETMTETLKILFHLMADVHQPLHCGYASDKGGNLIKVKFNDKESNLHKVWDSEIIEAKKIDIWACTKTLVGMNLSAKKKTELEKPDVMAWVNECRTLLPEVYKVNDGKIDQAYIDKNAKLIEKQLAIAGLRLAAVLKQVFK